MASFENFLMRQRPILIQNLVAKMTSNLTPTEAETSWEYAEKVVDLSIGVMLGKYKLSDINAQSGLDALKGRGITPEEAKLRLVHFFKSLRELAEQDTTLDTNERTSIERMLKQSELFMSTVTPVLKDKPKPST
jgi:hypothetical protein